ncbi:MAG TPA: HPr family phosphocarrier protein [Candidatus Anaerostipes avistercoris]|uniref:Phosphocarrier protein HPr n=1 Tax=Candidatus Anaerostipes avistercoris TaxID=2838462 RepID=A0A9D2PGW9_9FIRM|nr:HPr family phosphocarrier protein [uncultured Anaerostipes sp.]HJC50447.1 HPr family phosphocarrier protein [Candidatus Anaerostipes avistercoris]
MEQFDFIVQTPVGIHARPAMLLAKEAARFRSRIQIQKGDLKANAKNMASLLTLRAYQGDEVTFLIEGEDEQEAAEALQIFCSNNL